MLQKLMAEHFKLSWSYNSLLSYPELCNNGVKTVRLGKLTEKYLTDLVRFAIVNAYGMLTVPHKVLS